MDQSVLKQLPKARLVCILWSWRRPYFAKFRLANAVQFKVWWATIIFRAPWMEHSARAMFPHLFKDSRP